MESPRIEHACPEKLQEIQSEMSRLAGFAHMASLVVQWTQVLHEDSDVHQDPSLPANVDETYFLQVASCGYACIWRTLLRRDA